MSTRWAKVGIVAVALSLATIGGVAAAPGDHGNAYGVEKVDVCHLSEEGVYEVLTVGLPGWGNGHMDHEGDFLLSESAVEGECVYEEAV